MKTNIKILQVEFELGMFVLTSYILPSELTLHLGPFQDFKTSVFELNLSLALLSLRSRIKIDPVQLIDIMVVTGIITYSLSVPVG